MLEYFDVTTFLVLIIVFAISWMVTQRYQAFKFFKRNGLSGPEPHFIYGNVQQLFRSKDPLNLIKEWQKTYGRVHGFFEAGRPAYFVTDPELIKEITVKEFNKFMDRIKIIDLGDPFDKTLIDSTGDAWKRIRNTLGPAFTDKKLKQMTGIMNESLKIFLCLLKQKAENKEEVNIFKLLRGLTLQMIAESVFALEVDCQRDPENDFHKLVTAHIEASASSPLIELGLIFPWLIDTFSRFCFRLGISKIIKNIEDLLGILRRLIQQRMENPQEERIDMMQLMINAANDLDNDPIKESTDNDWSVKKGLSKTEIEINAFLFLVAGFDTTYNTASFVTHQLTLYPEVQKAVQEEIDHHIHTEIPTYEDVKKLTYLDQVISETLRLYPLVNIFLSRKCLVDCTISGIKFKKDMHVHIPPYLMHYDEEYWPEPEKFDPERFSLENKQNINPMTYLAFGSGPRNCIGRRLALMEIKLALVTMLKNFVLSKGPNFETKPKVDGFFLVLRPTNGVKIYLTPRSSVL